MNVGGGTPPSQKTNQGRKMERIKDHRACLPSLEPSLGGFSPLSLEGKVLDLRLTGKLSGKLLTSGWWKVQRQEVGEGQQGTTESLITACGLPCFPLFSDGYSCTSSDALPFPTFQSTALCISVDLFSSLSNFN